MQPAPAAPVLAPPAAVVPNAYAAPGPKTWGTLRAEDLAVERDRLAAEGFPPAAIRAIVTAQVRETFAARRKALEAAKSAAPYWRNTTYDPTIMAESRAL